MYTKYYILVAAFAACAACAPCESSIVSAGLIDLCPDDTSDSGSTGALPSTSGNPTGGGCDFSPGTVWGPCIDGGCPGAGMPAFCQEYASGAICLPACDGEGCPDIIAECGAGECLEDGVFAPTCVTGPEPGCPVPGMVCDFSPVGGVCVWP